VIHRPRSPHSGRSPIQAFVAVVGVASLACFSLASCKKPSGACELRFDESSPDGSIPAGLETCFPDWRKEDCSQGKLRNVTLGLKTSGYAFTEGASCKDRGYQDCSGGRGTSFYKTCPEDAKASPKQAARPEKAPHRKLDRPKSKPAKMTLDAPLDVPEDAPVKGNADGKQVLHLFADFQDPFAKRLLPTLDELVAEHPDLKIVFRHNPLPFHKDALLAHQAAVEAYTQKGNEGFWAMEDLLFANQRKLGRADLVGYAKKIGLDVAAFDKALDSGAHEARVQADKKVAADAGVRASPVMIVGTKVIRGALPKSTIEAVLAAP